jgi:hypothetical protein
MSVYTDVQTAPGAPRMTTDLMPLVKRAESAWGGGPAVNIYISHPNRANAAVEIWRQRDDRIASFPDRVAFDGVSGKTLRVLTKRSPARDAQSVLAGLHFIEWGGAAARWLYFAAGLMSAGMVATALVLFIAKREGRRTTPSPFLSMAKTITVAAVAGNIIACAVYLLAERIVPVDALDRRSMLASCYFLSWLACLVHAAIRPYASAWTEQLAAGGLLTLALPIYSWIVGIGLPVTIMRGDWIRAGADLMMLAIGMGLATGALLVFRRSRTTAA